MGEYDPVDPSADQTKKGWLTSILELGAWLGTLLSGFVAEAISRKYGILVAVTVFVVGVVIQITAVTGAGHNRCAVSGDHPAAPLLSPNRGGTPLSCPQGPSQATAILAWPQQATRGAV